MWNVFKNHFMRLRKVLENKGVVKNIYDFSPFEGLSDSSTDPYSDINLSGQKWKI